MQRREFIKYSFAAATSFSVAGCISNDLTKKTSYPKRPNVIFVLSDDQGYGDFGCYGNSYVKTPSMDRLYCESTRLTDFYTCPVCAPTRASMMTGRYNYRTSIWDTWHGGVNMDSDEYTLAEAMKQAGYKTSLFGKWHLGYNYPQRPQDQGFEDVLLWDLFHKPDKNRKDPVMILNGNFVETEGFEDDIVFDGAIEYLEKHKDSEQPFFMYVASAMPHTWVDYQIPPEDVEKFKRNPEINDFDAEIYAMIERLDNNLGRLLKKIDSLGLTDDTIVIYTSDNGPQFAPTSSRWNMDLRGSKGTTYEGGIKLPCFIRWPNVLSANKDINQVGACIDFMPTVLDMCGIDGKLPHRIDGISLWPYINGTKTDKKPRTLCGQFHRSDVPCVWPNSYIRDGDYKLVNGCELYNIAEDPYEKNDISRQMPNTFYELRDKYEQWFNNVTAEVVDYGEFQINPIIVGSDKQQLTNLRYSNENPKYGWPMKVIDKGPYKITVNHMQNDLFDETSVFEISIGNRVLSKKILPNDSRLVFDNVVIEPGRYNLKAGIKGTYRNRKYRSGPDVGHRNIYIEKVK